MLKQGYVPATQWRDQHLWRLTFLSPFLSLSFSLSISLLNKYHNSLWWKPHDAETKDREHSEGERARAATKTFSARMTRERTSTSSRDQMYRHRSENLRWTYFSQSTEQYVVLGRRCNRLNSTRYVARSVSALPSSLSHKATKRLVKWRHINERYIVCASNTSPVIPPFVIATGTSSRCRAFTRLTSACTANTNLNGTDPYSRSQ